MPSGAGLKPERRAAGRGCAVGRAREWGTPGGCHRVDSRGGPGGRRCVAVGRRRKGRRSLMRPLGDRRARVRFEVVGSFWGTVDLAEPARVININRTGAL